MITVRDLVRQALRMRPDRLVVGEVRGGEVVELLAALNTGHEGGCGTIHANSAIDVPARIEALALAAGLGREAAHSQLASAVDVVLHLARQRDGTRRLAQVAVPRRDPAGLVTMLPAVEFDGRPRPSWPRSRPVGRPAGVVMLVAVLAAVIAAALAMPRSPALAGGSRRSPPRAVAVGALGVVALLAVSTPRVAALALVALGVLAATGLLVRRRRDRRAARQVAGRVLETCELLAAELASGQPPGRSLGRAALSWPPLRPAAEADELGGDVPEALRRLRDPPGGGRSPPRRRGLGGVQQVRAGAGRQHPSVRRGSARRAPCTADRRGRARLGAGDRSAGGRATGTRAAHGLRSRRKSAGVPPGSPRRARLPRRRTAVRLRRTVVDRGDRRRRGGRVMTTPAKCSLRSASSPHEIARCARNSAGTPSVGDPE